MVTYHNPLDNVEDLAHHFFTRCLASNIVPYVVTKKTVFKWQEVSLFHFNFALFMYVYICSPYILNILCIFFYILCLFIFSYNYYIEIVVSYTIYYLLHIYALYNTHPIYHHCHVI